MSGDHVELGERSYSIEIGSGNLVGLDSKVADIVPQVPRTFIVSNQTVFNLYGEAVINSVNPLSRHRAPRSIILDGEAHAWDTLHGISTAMLEAELDRKSVSSRYAAV